MEEFIPTTFRMDVRAEKEAFFTQQEGNMHIIASWCNNNTTLV